jgi:hypothetical protein
MAHEEDIVITEGKAHLLTRRADREIAVID